MHGTSFIERYIQVDAHIAIRSIGTGSAKYGFLIEAVPVPEDRPPGDRGVETYTSWRYERIQQAPMFPGLIQVMEGDQQIIPSRIWLQYFDDVLTDLGKPLYLFEGSGVAVGEKLVLTFPDWKVSAGGIGVPVAGGESACQQVEATADTMDHGPGLSVDDGVKGLDITQAVELFAGLRIGIYRDGIGLVAPPRDDTFLKNWELGYGPIDSSLSV